MSAGSTAEGSRQTDREVWVRRSCALVVAAVAAFGSYEHQREFALRGGADTITAALWPLSVDGLVVLATVGVLTSTGRAGRRTRWVVWSAFVSGIAVSLAANIAAAPTLAWQPMLVAGWPPVALLLSVELLTHRTTARQPSQSDPRPLSPDSSDESSTESAPISNGTPNGAGPLPSAEASAEEIMWDYYQREKAGGRVPTGAELDRIAGTRDYGRSVLRRWRRIGRLDPVSDQR